MVATSVEQFVRMFAKALASRDEQACSALWGEGSIVLADRFVALAETPQRLADFLAKAWPVYDFLDLESVVPLILKVTPVTDSIVRVLVRYSFYDQAGAHLVDGDFEYILKRYADELRCHVGINISAEPNLAELASSRGFIAPG